MLNLSGTAGGTFSVTPAGLTIDPVTGAITLATSTNGIVLSTLSQQMTTYAEIQNR